MEAPAGWTNLTAFRVRRQGESPSDSDGGGNGVSYEAIVHAVVECGFADFPEGDAYTVSRILKEGQSGTG